MESEKTWTLGELAALLEGTLEGPPERTVKRPVPAGYPDPEGIAFAESETYLKRIDPARIGVVLLAPEAEAIGAPVIRVPNPRAAFARVLALVDRPLALGEGIHPSAIVSRQAKLGEGCRVGAYAIVEAGADIGPDCRIFPFAFIGENCRLGPRCVLFPGVVLYRDVTLGEDVVIHAGCVLGADGFGYFWDGTQRRKIPQVGRVDIGDRVEMGANSCVDRATCGVTRLGPGVKIDNLVQIAHNVSVGAHTVIAGQSGLAGSAEVGERCEIGGQVAINARSRVASDVVIGGRSALMGDIRAPGVYWGTPPRPVKETLREAASLRRLPDLFHRLRQLEAELERLKEQLGL